MDEAQKAYELQAKVRHNASDFKNALKDLYSWEKDIKLKEELFKSELHDERHLKTLPVRTQIKEQQLNDNKNQEMQKKRAASNNPPVNGVDKKNERNAITISNEHELANTFKESGNKYVKLGKYEHAIFEYTKAIGIVADAIFYSNRAFCYLKLNRYNECIDDCQLALSLDKRNVKALYRRMQANESLANNLDALKDCTTILMIEPKNPEANKSLERINERLRKTAKTEPGPNFSALRDNFIDVLPIEKPPYKRSTQPLERVAVTDVIGPKRNENDYDPVRDITDEEIDRLFNSYTGPIIEVKNKPIEEQPIGKSKKKRTRKTLRAKDMIEMAKTTTKPEQSLDTKVPDKTVQNTEIQNPKDCANTAQTKESKPQSNAISVDKTNAITQPSITAAVAKNIVENGTKKVDKPTDVAVTPNNVLAFKNVPLPPPPTSTAQFYTNWKELSGEQKYQYLKSIQIGNLCKILGAGFDSDTLNEVLQTVRDFYVTNKDASAAITLLEISKNNEVGILSMLMSSEERKVLTDILAELKKVPANAAVITIIGRNFNVK